LIPCGNEWEFSGSRTMSDFFFCGAHTSKLDEKNRFVLPQDFRYALIEDGKLEFTIGMGLGGALCIWRRSEIDQIVRRLRPKLHLARYQRFFTFFFSTLHHTTCDKIGRVLIPPLLKKAAKINGDIVIAGVLSRLEIWPEEKYNFDLETFIAEEGSEMGLLKLTEEIFASPEQKKELIDGEQEERELSCLSDDR